MFDPLDTISYIMKKRGLKRKRSALEKKEEEKTQKDVVEELQDQTAERLAKIRKIYINKQRTLVLSSRGITHRYRHLMNDIIDLLPHSKKDNKLDTKDLWVLNEVCELKNCNNCIFFECKKKRDLYLWVAKVPTGPSIKFLVLNGTLHFYDLLPHVTDALVAQTFSLIYRLCWISVPCCKNCNQTWFYVTYPCGHLHLFLLWELEAFYCIHHAINWPSPLTPTAHTKDELKFTGNCLKGSRPILSFDAGFDASPHFRLMKEVISQVR